MNHLCLGSVKEFINESKTFNGFDFLGSYTMDRDIFFKLLSIYVETGENILDCYSTYVHLSWKDYENDNHYYDFDQITKIESDLSKLRRFKVVDPDDLAEQRYKLKRYFKRYQSYQESLRNEPRRTACSFTSKKEIKEQVFKLYGKVCLCCGSTQNISIDHVIPVCNGGENSIDNFQPLCKSCNSKKSTKTTDYRKKETA